MITVSRAFDKYFMHRNSDSKVQALDFGLEISLLFIFQGALVGVFFFKIILEDFEFSKLKLNHLL